MKSIRQTSLLVAVLAVLAGCASNVPLETKPAPVETRTPTASTTPSGGSSASTAPAGSGNVASVDLTQSQSRTTPAATGPTERVVYFDFDSYVVKDEFRGVVDAHAKLLTADRSKRLVIEGHTDERGGSEYNLALDQRRAEAVAKSLALLGANEGQIESVSFGKERPAVTGSDEAAWAKNRRAEIKPR